jgi:hypothetical protein
VNMRGKALTTAAVTKLRAGASHIAIIRPTETISANSAISGRATVIRALS